MQTKILSFHTDHQSNNTNYQILVNHLFFLVKKIKFVKKNPKKSVKWTLSLFNLLPIDPILSDGSELLASWNVNLHIKDCHVELSIFFSVCKFDKGKKRQLFFFVLKTDPTKATSVKLVILNFTCSISELETNLVPKFFLFFGKTNFAINNQIPNSSFR